jgi:hypothetical protein
MWLDRKIRSWLADPAHAENVLLFETRSGRPVSPDRVQANLRTVRAWAGLPDWIVSHVMRKSVATAVTGEHGTDQGMYLMGHADTRVLEGHYDKRSTIPYSITQVLEAFDPDAVADAVPESPLAAAVAVDADLVAQIDAAHAEAQACSAPGLMEALNPREDESHGSTEEVPG